MLRSVLRYRLDARCVAPALPQAAATTFVPLVEAALPALASCSSADTLESSHTELVSTLWVLLAPPSSASAAAAPAAAPAAVADAASAPPAFPSELSPVQLELEASVLQGVPAMLRASAMRAPLRRRMLQARL